MCVFSRLLRTSDTKKRKKNRRKVFEFLVQSRYHRCKRHEDTKQRRTEIQQPLNGSIYSLAKRKRRKRSERACNCVWNLFVLKIARSSVLPITSNRWNSVRCWCPLNITFTLTYVYDRTIATQDVKCMSVFAQMSILTALQSNLLPN